MLSTKIQPVAGSGASAAKKINNRKNSVKASSLLLKNMYASIASREDDERKSNAGAVNNALPSKKSGQLTQASMQRV